MRERCPLCDGRALAPTDRRLVHPSGRERRFALACSFCGLLLAGAGRSREIRADLAARLEEPVFISGEDAPYGLDIHTLRTAATSHRRGVEPLGPDQAEALRHPHSILPASAALFDLVPSGPAISIGILCRSGEWEAVRGTLSALCTWTDDIVVLLDAALDGPRPVEAEGCSPGTVRLAGRPLGEDFAAQRNALQALARHGWMLQLDADETLSPETGPWLGALARMAERQGARSIGLPRRNLVGGVLSDLHPDTQYRLNHRGVAYRGRVHERPDRPWPESLIALQAAILHHLDRAHVETRSRRYEAMEPGGGRLQEAGFLLEPYRP